MFERRNVETSEGRTTEWRPIPKPKFAKAKADQDDKEPSYQLLKLSKKMLKLTLNLAECREPAFQANTLAMRCQTIGKA